MYTIFGGKLGCLGDLSIQGELPVSAEKCISNAESNLALGLKTYRSWQTDKTRLAVVGGGPSVIDHIQTLRDWDGDIWAINGAWDWCRNRGIETTFFACDPHPIVTQWAVGAKKAILEVSCDPEVFKLLGAADVYTFDAEKSGIAGYASTASCAPHLAIRMGYRSVKFFGCDSSYLPNNSHAYMDENRKEEMIIRCDGHDFLTAPDLYLQALGLAEYIRQVPEFISEESNGLLTAMINDPKYHVMWVSQGLVDIMNIEPEEKPEKKLVSGAMAMADNLEAFEAA